MIDRDPTPADIYAARRRLRRRIRATPLVRSDWLGRLAGCPVHLKLECLQRTGSFKLRGATNAVARMDRAALAAGIVAASAGNHGQGIALAARRRKARATVFVPAGAPETKKRRIRSLGAVLRESSDYDAAEIEARAHAERVGARYVHPFADADVVAGQGTIGIELMEALPALREVVVPIGGGGLIAGIGTVLRAIQPGTRIIGVQAERARVMHDSLRAGRVVPPPPAEPSLADGLVGGIEAVSLRRVAALVEDVALVDEDEIAAAIRGLYREEGIVAEGSGAVGVAAVMQGRLQLAGPAVLVITGGNIDGPRLAEVLQES